LGNRSLARSQTFSLSDGLALGCAAAIVAGFAFTGLKPIPTARNELVSLRMSSLALPLGITVAFALTARLARGVDLSGALAGSAVAFVLAARDLRMFWTLLLVFAVTLAATRLGQSRKHKLRAAEPSRGRSASQVMANLGLAGLVVALAPPGWQLPALAALAEAAADTCSSELGMALPGRTLLLTSMKSVIPGTDGGVSLRGTLAAIAAAGVVALLGWTSGLVSGHHAMIIVYAGVLGMLIDSLLGALLERRGYLNNDLVNLLSTAGAVGIAWGLG
jgi:uncharacterized protein (TIGR00297 family)